jgi:predicted secreted protein
MPLNKKSLAKLNPSLAKEWHPTKNGDLTAYDVTLGSGKKIWWKCDKGDDHEWESRVHHRVNGIGCPICSNRKIVISNCLATLKPRLAKDWHPTKNGDLTPKDVGIGTAKKVWWKCDKGDDHEWDASIVKRSNGKGCPICSGHKVAKSTSLATLKPSIAKQWHPTKNSDLTPFDVSIGSSKEIWWKCNKGDDHEWKATVNNRIKGSGCAVCVNQVAVNSNCLATVYPELAEQWHPTKNGNLTPNEVTFGSNKKVWWKCPKGKEHEWKTSVAHRSYSNTGCPFCFNPSSVPELRILSELRTIFTAVEHRVNFDGFEVDIYIPELKIGIEYDGKFWHQKKEKQDLIKNDALKEKVKLIRVRDKGLFAITDKDILQKTTKVTVETIKLILEEISKLIKIESHETLNRINNYKKNKSWAASDSFRKLHAAKNHIAFEDSIEYLNPEISKLWHPTKNEPLLPKHFLPGSNKKVWWKCDKGYDHEWETQIKHLCLQNTGCSVCSNQKIVVSNSLTTLNPELAKQWHPTKNGDLTTDKVGPGSNKKVWWKCEKGDDHEWNTSVVHRTNGKGCPVCSNNKIVVSNSLTALNPELAKEWHPTKNGDLTPDKVGPGSNKKVWWKCPKGKDHEWEAIIISRDNGRACPICSNKKIIISNSLATTNPVLAKQWHPTKNGQLTPYNVSLGSSKKVWWKCIKFNDHEWQSVIKNRKRGDGCTICSKHKIV